MTLNPNFMTVLEWILSDSLLYVLVKKTFKIHPRKKLHYEKFNVVKWSLFHSRAGREEFKDIKLSGEPKSREFLSRLFEQLVKLIINFNWQVPRE